MRKSGLYLAAVIIVPALFCPSVEGQSIYDWWDSAPDANWKRGADGARWTDGLWDQPPDNNILRFSNDHQRTMTNNVPAGYKVHQILFGPGGTGDRTIRGNSIILTNNNGDAKIQNDNSGNHSIEIAITANTTGNDLQLNPVSGDLIFTSTLNNNGHNIEVYGGSGNILRFEGVLSGSGAMDIDKDDSNRGTHVKIAGSSTYSGPTYLNQGYFSLEESGTIGSGGTIFVGNGSGNNWATRKARLWISDADGGTSISNAVQVNHSSGTAYRILGSSNTSGTNTFAGAITNQGPMTLVANAVGGALKFDSPLVSSAAYDVTLSGTGTVIYAAANTFTGTNYIDNGTLLISLDSGDPLDCSEIKLGYTTGDDTLALDCSAGVTLDQGFNVRSTGGTKSIHNIAGTNTLSNNIYMDGDLTVRADAGSIALAGSTLDLKNQTLTVSGDGHTIISGNLTDSTGSGKLTKTGEGTNTVSGNNSFVGATTISGGTMVYNGTNAGSAVAIGSGGTLTGEGSVGATTVNGAIAPGLSIGTITVSSLVLPADGTNVIEIGDVDGSAGSDWDLIKVGAAGAGTVTISASQGTEFVLALDSSSTVNFDTNNTYTWMIVQASALNNFDASDFSVNEDNWTKDKGDGTFSVYENSGDLYLKFSTVYPGIKATPTSLAFSNFKGSNPADQTLVVTNIGEAVLNYEMTNDQSWLSITTTNGSIWPGTGSNHVVSVASSNLAAGAYTGTITITDPKATNSPYTVSVSLVVSNLPGSTGCYVNDDAGPEALSVHWVRPTTYNVMVVRRHGDWPDLPTNGVHYSRLDTYGPADRNLVIVPEGTGSDFLDVELLSSSVSNYFYAFYTESNDHYSVDRGTAAAGEVTSTNTTGFGFTPIEEAFAYFTNTSLNAGNRGNGWTNAWTENHPGEYSIQEHSFVNFSGSPGNYGHKVRVHPDAFETHTAYRSFTAVTSGCIFASFTMNYGEVDENKADKFFVGLSFVNGTNEAAFGGLAFPSKRALSIAADKKTAYAGNYDFSGGYGNDYIVFLKYDFETRDMYAKGYYIPNSTAPPSEPTWDFSTNINKGVISRIDGVRLGAGGADNSPGAVYFDEVRVGQSWSDLMGTVIAFQGFEPPGASDNWEYDSFDGGGTIETTADRKNSGGYSLRLSGADPYIILTNINIRGFTNVALSVAFCSDGADNGDDLYMDVSYDGMASTGMSMGLIKGADGTADDFGFGETRTTSTNPNPYQVSIPSTESWISVKIRSTANSANDQFYIDDITLTGVPAPEMDVYGLDGFEIASGDAVAITNDGTDFGVIYLTDPDVDRTFIVTNTGRKTLELTADPAIELIGDINAFSVAMQPASSNLVVTTGTTFTVRFNPPSLGLYTALVSIANNEQEENPYRFAIRGEGVEPTIRFQGFEGEAQDDWNYIELEPAAGVVDTNATRTRTGTYSLHVHQNLATARFDNVSIRGYTNVTLQIGLAALGPDLGEDLYADISYDGGVSWAAEKVLDGGGNVDLAFEQTDVDRTPQGNPYIVHVSDTETQIQVRVRSHKDMHADDYFFIDDVRLMGYAVPQIDVQGNSVVVTNGDVTPSAADHTDFGVAYLSTQELVRTFTIFNRGATNLTLTGTQRVGLSGDHAADFEVTTQPAVGDLDPEESTTFEVTFNPSAAGLRSATLTITNNDTGDNPFVFDIQGVGTNDNDSYVEGPASQVASVEIASTVDTPAEAVDVFRFAVVDSGLHDATGTLVNVISIHRAAGDTADWTDMIQGVGLDSGGALSLTSTTITDTVITMGLAADELTVADGKTNEVTLSAYLNTSGIADGVKFQFMIDGNSHDFDASTLASGFNPDFGSDLLSNIHTVQVAGTVLGFVEGPPSTIGVGGRFRVVVQAQDANGNRDTDSEEHVEVYRKTGPGGLYGGDLKYLTNGVQSWTTLWFITNGTHTVEAENFLGSLGSVTSGDVLVTWSAVTNWFQGFEGAWYDTWTVMSGGSWTTNLPGVTDTPANSRIRSGASSWQVNNGTGTLILSNAVSSGFNTHTVTVHVSSTSTNGSQGADSTDYVRIYVALNGDSFREVPDVTIKGLNNMRWTYDGGDTVKTVAGTSVTGTNYSHALIAVPDGTRKVAVKIVARNNHPGEVWNIDDISLSDRYGEGVDTDPPVIYELSIEGSDGPGGAGVGVWINEVDYNCPGSDTNEWIELVGEAGSSLDNYELALINQAGTEYGTFDLADAGWTFTDEVAGYGFFVLGIVNPATGTADHTPAGWVSDEIQQGPGDSVQLRYKADSENVHLLDYGGDNATTSEDQATAKDDSDVAVSSIYLTGGPGDNFDDYSWENSTGKATPGAANDGQSFVLGAGGLLSLTDSRLFAGDYVVTCVVQDVWSGLVATNVIDYGDPPYYYVLGTNDGVVVSNLFPRPYANGDWLTQTLVTNAGAGSFENITLGTNNLYVVATQFHTNLLSVTSSPLPFLVTDDDTVAPEFGSFAFAGSMFTTGNIGHGIAVTGMVRDAYSGLYGINASQSSRRPRVNVYRPDGSHAVVDATFTTGPTTSTDTAWQPVGYTIDNTVLTMTGVYTVQVSAVDFDEDRPSDRLSETESFTFTSSIDPTADSDGDGVDNSVEFLCGTHVGVSNSHLRIMAVEPSGLNNVRLSLWLGEGAGRTYQILGANSVTTKTVLASGTLPSSSTIDGANYWTNVNAVAQTSQRLFNVAVSHATGSYTNTRDWAMYVQNRPASQRFLVCLPVDLLDPGEENLKGEAGAQLARGLYAGTAATTNEADRLEYWTSAKQWKILYLITNAATSSVYWWDPSTGTTADVPVTVGMPLWLVRGSKTAPRSNAVFGGMAFKDSAASSFNLTTNDTPWNLFGWPLPQKRWHRSSVATPNQLGFYAIGTGGKSSQPAFEHQWGDQIWVWKDNGFKYYWLIGQFGTSQDGRWWDDLKAGYPKYADFALEPGMAYYYYHTTNWSSTNFTWTPQSP